MIDSHPFCSMSISTPHPHPIPQIRLFQTLTLKLQGQGHGCGQRARPEDHTVSPVSNWFVFFFFSHQSDNHSWDIAILKFDLEKSKVKVMGKVKGQGLIVHPVSNQCTSFSFHTNRTNHSWDIICPIERLTLKKHIRNIQRKFGKKKKEFPTEFL